MEPAPPEIGRARVLCYAVIDQRCRPTGFCRHVVGGELIAPAAGLAICKYPDDTEYYLFYCDEDWQTVTDTCHETLEKAKRQAEAEYEGVEALWSEVNAR